jgi:hypothetical protein
VDVRRRGADVGDHPRQGLRAVDEQLDAVAGPRLERPSGGPAARGRLAGAVAVTRETTAMVRGDRALDAVTEDVVEPVERERRHPARYWPFWPIVVVGGGSSGGAVVVGGGGGGAGGGVVVGGAGLPWPVCSVTGGGVGPLGVDCV